jgi:hypothetical protein
MENSTKILVGLALAGVVAYVVYKKKPASPVVSTVKKSPVDELLKPQYPSGLKEGDYIKVGDYAEVYLLKNGKKLPITYEWMMRYAVNQWDSVKTIAPIDGMDIPTGEVLSV